MRSPFPSFALVRVLIAAIERLVAGYDQRAQPFRRDQARAEVLAKAVRKPITTSGAEH